MIKSINLISKSSLAALLLLASLGNQTHGASVENLEASGFQTFPTPRTFDGPGTVFRITLDQTRFPVVKLKIPVEQAGDESFASYTRKGAWSLSAVLKFVGALRLLADPKVSADLGYNVEMAVQIGQGRRERTYDSDVTAALKAASIDFRDDSRYYIVRETIAVSELSYRFAKGREFDSGVGAIIRKMVQGNAGLKWANEEKTELTQKFDKPHRVFFTAEEIVRPAALLTANPERRLVTEGLTWTTETQ